MDINDFKDVRKYKYIVPIIYISNWILMWVGPLFFPVVWQYICVFMVLYLNWKMAIMLVISIVGACKAWQIMDKVEDIEKHGYRRIAQVGEQLLFAFIIPSYNQDIDLLSSTLNVLSEHRRAKTQYLIFLAMEEHEQNSDKKAKELLGRFQGKFRLMDFTVHKIQVNQQKGKASNVSWCAEHLEPIFKHNLISPDQVFLTIIDADTWAPNIYFDQMQEHIINNWEQRYTFIYQPPQMFTRNHMEVPMLVRDYDLIHGTVHFTNLLSLHKISFPLSNYSLSFNLIKRIGFWDTCADAIGEDFHTTQKAFWKTDGEVRCIPIYALFNQINIETGRGILADVKARFWQAQRHARGVADVAWNLKFFFSKSFNWRCFWMMYQVLQNHFLPAIAPWLCFSLNFQSRYFAQNRPQHWQVSTQSACYSTFFQWARWQHTTFTNLQREEQVKSFIKLQVESLWHIFEYPIFFTVNLFGISIPTFIIAAFGSLKANQEYVTAQKHIRKDHY